jgi:hypothetical protein
MPTLLFCRPTQATLLVGLPNLAGAYVHGRQPAVAIATCVDTFEVTQVENLSVPLCRMAHDGRLAGTMWAGLALSQGKPQQLAGGLFRKWNVRLVSGVHENMPIRFVPQAAIAQEVGMNRGDVPGVGTIERGQGFGAAEGKPRVEHVFQLAVANGKHHFLVVTEQGDEIALPTERHDSLDHCPTVRPAIDVIPQPDDCIIGPRPDFPQHRIQGGDTAVGISDSDSSR